MKPPLPKKKVCICHFNSIKKEKLYIYMKIVLSDIKNVRFNILFLRETHKKAVDQFIYFCT